MRNCLLNNIIPFKKIKTIQKKKNNLPKKKKSNQN